MSVFDFSQWLAATGPSLLIQNTAWAVPAVQTVHILALSVVLASMAMLDLRMLGLAGRRHSVDDMASRFIPALWIALVALLATGLVLIVGEPERALMNPAFRWKMALLAAAIPVTAGVQQLLNREPGFWETTSQRRTAARVVAVVSLSLWLAIAVLGRWIAYIEPLQP